VGSEKKGALFFGLFFIEYNVIFMSEGEWSGNFKEVEINFWEFLSYCVLFAGAVI